MGNIGVCGDCFKAGNRDRRVVEVGVMADRVEVQAVGRREGKAIDELVNIEVSSKTLAAISNEDDVAVWGKLEADGDGGGGGREALLLVGGACVDERRGHRTDDEGAVDDVVGRNVEDLVEGITQ